MKDMDHVPYKPAYVENVNLERKVILIVGSKSCLAYHLINQLQQCKAVVKLIDIVDKEPSDNTGPYEQVELEDAVKEVDTCVMLQDCKDFNIYPDVRMMNNINVYGTEQILRACTEGGVKRVILGSSVFVMTSDTWPSVMNPESASIPPDQQMPFPDYSRSRMQAEKLLNSIGDGMQSMILRLTPVYGEHDDEDSFMIKALKLAQYAKGYLPVLGDKGGVIQHTYAGNVAWGIIKAIQKMVDDSTCNKEIVFLLDDTPREGVYQLLEPYLNARGFSLGLGVPFWLVYIPLLALERVMKSVTNRLNVEPPWPMTTLPSANYLYIFFYHWIFFQGVKARVYLNYIPPFSYDQAVKKSAEYYSKCRI